MRFLMDECDDISMRLELEEYIPLKIIICGIEETINYFSYSKDKKSLLEIAVGTQSRTMKKITLLMSRDYEICDNKFCIDEIPCKYANIKLEEYNTVECEKFSTHLFEDAIRVSISKENIEKYIKMDRLYIGISSTNEIIEICVIRLSEEEVRHIKTELEYQ